jgi:hypothetical protein
LDVFRLKRIPYPRDRFDFVDLLWSEEWDIILYPITQSNMELLKETVNHSFTVFSRPINVITEGHIISAIRPGERNIFEFVFGFETPVWITLFLSMLLLPLTIALIDKSFSGFFTNLWNYSYLILSESIPRMPKSWAKRTFLSIWLLISIVLLAGYSGVLRDFFIKSIPNDAIDSWEDLYERKELRIATLEVSFIKNFAKKNANNDEMARNFLSRIETLTYGDSRIYDQALDYLFSQKYVVSAPKCLIDDCYYFMPSGRNIHDCEKLHVSQYGAGISPYFIPMSKSIDKKIQKNINQM